MIVWNTNNHQMIHHVVLYVVSGISKFFHQKSMYGSADFSTFDGDNKVGEGVLSTS